MKVASAMGVSKSVISLWELGQSIPAADKFFRLAKLYGVDLETLYRAAGYDQGGTTEYNE